MEIKELHSKSPQELLTLINDLKAELFTLRFKNSTGQLDQPHKIKLIKRDIARVFTILVKREIENKKAKPQEQKIIKKVQTNKKAKPQEQKIIKKVQTNKKAKPQEQKIIKKVQTNKKAKPQLKTKSKAKGN